MLNPAFPFSRLNLQENLMKKTDVELFSERGLAHFHDAVFDGCKRSLQVERLVALFAKLPVDLQELAREWGLSDRSVGDAICRWVSENPSSI